MKTVQNWENQQACPAIDELYKLCDLFDCDIDFLFGKQSCPRKQIASVHDCTGLSESAIRRLQQLKEAKEDLPFSDQWFRFYSAVICDFSIHGALLTLPAKIRRLDEYGFQNEQEEVVFDDAAEAKLFYEFELQSCIMGFINSFFKNETFA